MAAARRCVVEPLEQRLQFSGNLISGILAIIHNWDPGHVSTQAGGYDPKISLVPFGQK